jgi:hypothetical protein
MILEIDVRQCHLDAGMPRNVSFCAVAVAATDALAFRKLNFQRLRVNTVELEIWWDYDKVRTYRLPLDVQEKIGIYDHHLPGTVEPFRFEIDLGDISNE